MAVATRARIPVGTPFLVRHHFQSLIPVGVVGNIRACHARARGSIPRSGALVLLALYSKLASARRIGIVTIYKKPTSIPCVASTLTRGVGPPSGGIRKNWNDTEKISMAPAQG